MIGINQFRHLLKNKNTIYHRHKSFRTKKIEFSISSDLSDDYNIDESKNLDTSEIFKNIDVNSIVSKKNGDIPNNILVPIKTRFFDIILSLYQKDNNIKFYDCQSIGDDLYYYYKYKDHGFKYFVLDCDKLEDSSYICCQNDTIEKKYNENALISPDNIDVKYIKFGAKRPIHKNEKCNCFYFYNEFKKFFVVTNEIHLNASV